MRLASAMLTLTLFFATTPAVFTTSASNATINVCASDLYATVPLCTYWYEDRANQGITPVMTITNNGSAPISVSGASFLNGEAAIRGVPCDLAPFDRIDFVLAENPDKTAISKRSIKCAIVFIITKTGE